MKSKRSFIRSFFVSFLAASAAISILAGFGIIYYVLTQVKEIYPLTNPPTIEDVTATDQKPQLEEFTAKNQNPIITYSTDSLDSMKVATIIIQQPRQQQPAMLEPSDNELNTLSLLGEFFGGVVGSIWALAGVILFYLALIYQRRELELQREELLESRKIMDSQSKTIEIQQFENTFFQLLEFHLSATKRIETQDGGNGFDKMYEDFKKAVAGTKRKRKKDGSSQNLDTHAFETSFRQVYDSFRNTLSHYIESYKALLFLVDKKSKDPYFYVNIIKPHLTEQEVLIQFYYVILYDKDGHFQKVVENYGLFERLNFRAVQAIDKLHLEELKDSAYERTPEVDSDKESSDDRSESDKESKKKTKDSSEK